MPQSPPPDFYQCIPPFRDFSQLGNNHFFRQAPDDWVVLLSDVRGSTQAVQEGRAKDVNMIGAAVITLVTNDLGRDDIPSVFGGDGATLLLTRIQFDRLRPQLVGLMRLSRFSFNLELRIGAVPVQHLLRTGHPLAVGRYQLTENTVLAQFVGTGISEAEKLIKERAPQAEILQLEEPSLPPILNGLSCRMSAFPNQKGVILSFLVKARHPDSEFVRNDLLDEIKAVLNHDFRECNPVKENALQWPLLPKTLFSEIKLNGGFARLPLVVLRVLMANILIKLNVSAGGFVPQKYKKEIPQQSDFKKFDDCLRMVVDCSPVQADQLERLFLRAQKDGMIFFGLHRSEKSVVTCLTLSASTGHHIHFVDGEDGGYTRAAIQLKGQIKNSSLQP